MSAADIKNSTKEEREECIRNTHRCVADCENCGQCKVFHGKTPEVAILTISKERETMLRFLWILEECEE